MKTVIAMSGGREFTSSLVQTLACRLPNDKVKVLDGDKFMDDLRAEKITEPPALIVIDRNGLQIFYSRIKEIKGLMPNAIIWTFGNNTMTEGKLKKMNALPHVNDDDLLDIQDTNTAELIKSLVEEIMSF